MKDEHNQQFNATAVVVVAFVVIIEVVFLNKFVVKVDLRRKQLLVNRYKLKQKTSVVISALLSWAAH